MTEREMVSQQIAEMQAQLADQSAGAPLTGAQTWEAPNAGGTTGSQYVSGQPNQAYAADNLPGQGGFTKEGAKSGGPGYAVEANPAYTTGPRGVVSGYPQQGYPQQGPMAVGPGYPQQGYGPGGAPAYPPGSPYNQSGGANDARSWVDAILFVLGFVFGVPWLVGALLPLCRRPSIRIHSRS
ncbi:hypothetical protein ABBQ38_008739 [Trebouxia sp. C0009 RCD-2024]